MSEIESITFGERLRRSRLAAGLSQEALAERARLSPDAVAALERGRRTSPRAATVVLLADALGLTAVERSGLIAAAHQREAPAAAPATRPALAPATPLIGRARELEHLLALLAPARPRARLVTLVGPGGVGKTRLAFEAAARLERDYRDGVTVVDLAPVREQHLVAATIARDLGLREEGAQSARDLLLSSLRGRCVLLVLDNFEQVLGAAPMLADLLAAAPEVTILVTSRAPLRLRQERRVPLAGLATLLEASVGGLQDVLNSPALRLFVERAQVVAPELRLDESNAATVAAICRRLDGLPLAIELAAARCAVLPPTELLSRLGQALPLLTGGLVDLPARQRTLRATLEWSEALLPRSAQGLFRRLAVFAGSFTLRAAEVVMAASQGDGDVLDGLQLLLDHSLLTPAPERGGQLRFALLETVREYAAERLVALDEAQPTRRAHADHYLRLAETARPLLFSGDQIAWLAGLDEEHANLRAALAYLLQEQDAEHALRLAGALWRFWYIRCYFSEGRRWLEDTLALVPGCAPPGEVVAALVGLAVIAYAQTDYARAEAAAMRGAPLARLVGAQADLAILLNILAGVARNRSQYERAIELGEECVALARRLDDTWTLALSLHNLADVARLRGAFDRADTLAAQSLELARGLADRWAMLQAELVRGWIAHDCGDLDSARSSRGVCPSHVISGTRVTRHTRWPGWVRSRSCEAI